MPRQAAERIPACEREKHQFEYDDAGERNRNEPISGRGMPLVPAFQEGERRSYPDDRQYQQKRQTALNLHGRKQVREILKVSQKKGRPSLFDRQAPKELLAGMPLKI